MGRKNRNRAKKVEPRTEPRSGLRRHWILGLILGATFLTFGNTLFNDFAYDDTTQILDNLFIRDLRNIPKALVTETWYWRVQQNQDPNKQDRPSTPYYRPVFTLYLMILWKLFGASAPGWHLFNVLLHVLVVYLVFLVAEKVTKDTKLSAIAAALFALHPLRSESVAWISGLTDPLLAVFLLSSFYFFARFREEGRSRSFVLSLALFILAAFSKEPAVAFSLLIPGYELFVINQDKSFRERLRPAVTYFAAFFLVAAFYFSARFFALGFLLNNISFRNYPAHQIALTIPLVIWKYLGLLFWPVELSLFHSTEMVTSPLDLRFVLPFAGLLPLAYVLWRLRSSTVARFAMLWFAVNLLPVLNLSAFSEEFLVQERYLYVPSVGFSLLIALALVKLPLDNWFSLSRRRVARVALVAVVVFLLAGRSLAQNNVWKDDITVWIHGAEVAPDTAIAHYILGHKLLKLGDYPKTAEEFEAYLKLIPDNDIVLGNLASTYVLIYQYQAAANPGAGDPGLLERALALIDKGLRLTPDSAPMWDTAGTIYTFETSLKNYDRALACYQRALSIVPNHAMINFHMGGVLVKRGNADQAIPFLKTALDLRPDIVDAHKFLAYAYKAKGQLKEAIDELNTYLKLEPNAPDLAKVSKDLQDMRAQLQSAPQS